MREHRNEPEVLMAATACLYNLVSNNMSKTMHPGLLASVVELLLHAIEMTPNLFQVINYQSHGFTLQLILAYQSLWS